METDHLKRLEQAREEILRFTKEVEECHAKKEIRGLEQKILIHEKFHGKEREELLHHINKQIHLIEESEREKKNKAIAMALTTIIMILAFASTFYSQNKEATGYVVSQEHNQQADCQTQEWNEPAKDNITLYENGQNIQNLNCSNPSQDKQEKTT
jgi:hypothetical protein